MRHHIMSIGSAAGFSSLLSNPALTGYTNNQLSQALYQADNLSLGSLLGPMAGSLYGLGGPQDSALLAGLGLGGNPYAAYGGLNGFSGFASPAAGAYGSNPYAGVANLFSAGMALSPLAQSLQQRADMLAYQQAAQQQQAVFFQQQKSQQGLDLISQAYGQLQLQAQGVDPYSQDAAALQSQYQALQQAEALLMQPQILVQQPELAQQLDGFLAQVAQSLYGQPQSAPTAGGSADALALLAQLLQGSSLNQAAPTAPAPTDLLSQLISLLGQLTGR